LPSDLLWVVSLALTCSTFAREDTVDVGGETAVKLREVDVEGSGARSGRTGVVDETIEPTPPVDGKGDQRLDIGL
jgi:hypothetical protein